MLHRWGGWGLPGYAIMLSQRFSMYLYDCHAYFSITDSGLDALSMKVVVGFFSFSSSSFFFFLHRPVSDP
jgi:hypothetical protein